MQSLRTVDTTGDYQTRMYWKEIAFLWRSIAHWPSTYRSRTESL